ncbi:hypothetical protein HPB51_017563 [Rhipicephalus microplus]|uniref:Uncharacterized protein n=1 Tax=Rhipicephalus microplus TaxID=6941 RepID=A0A9J6F5G6_RHIMP|nr:hypothetical protein HPB51_017563 [Rhipicephalus microplus]
MQFVWRKAPNRIQGVPAPISDILCRQAQARPEGPRPSGEVSIRQCRWLPRAQRLSSAGPARTIRSWRPIQIMKRSRTRGSCRSRSTFRLRLGSRSRSRAHSVSRTRSQSKSGIRPRPSSGAHFRSSLGPGQGKPDAPSTRPDPLPRADCGHARGLKLSGAAHDTEDRSRGKSHLAWADRVRSNDGELPMQCYPSPEHARVAEILRLKKENAQLKDTLYKMENEMAEFKRMLSTMRSNTEGETTDTPVPAPFGDGPMAIKRRAVVSKLKNTESQIQENKQMLVTITENIKMVARSVASLTESVRKMQAALSDPVEGLRAMNERIIALENYAKLPKSAPHGASPGNVEVAIPVHVDSLGVN